MSSGSSSSYDGSLVTEEMSIGIGGDPGSSSNWAGAMNDIMIWDRALSDEEMERLYFIQLDATMTQELRVMLGGVSPIPSIHELYFDGVALSDEDVIENNHKCGG